MKLQVPPVIILGPLILIGVATINKAVDPEGFERAKPVYMKGAMEVNDTEPVEDPMPKYDPYESLRHSHETAVEDQREANEMIDTENAFEYNEDDWY